MSAAENTPPNAHPPLWKTLLAFGFIYFVWGSTYLAIRVGVHQVPPLMFAAMRFFAAGAALYGWTRLRREQAPTARQWLSACILAFLIFVGDYGLLFWAEIRVPSGIAAVMMATIPVFIAFGEIVFLGTQKLAARLVIALVVGIAGVAVLTLRTLNLSGVPVEPLGAFALIVAAMNWGIATILTRKLELPPSKVVSSGAQMLAGGIMLFAFSAAFGEFARFDPRTVSSGAWWALAYLVVVGSIIGYTAYIWLLHHQSPTKVGTYAYVNPVVAVIVGYFLGGEELGMRTVVGTALVIVSVVLITTARKAIPPQVAR
jgi:drug/metabolite transporter (DMT)-like permease